MALAADGTVVVLQAPMGSGKTLGVASWINRRQRGESVLWLNAGRLHIGRGAGDRGLFWNRIRAGLIDLGIGPIARVPAASATGGTWSRWLRGLADLMNIRGDRYLLVLDDFPSGSGGPIGRQLAALVAQATSLRMLIICTGSPAVDLARLSASGRCVRIGVDVMTMDAEEVEELLRRRGLPTDRGACAAIATQTAGWALGVDRAAGFLAETGPRDQALSELSGALADVIEDEVLAQLPAAGREVIIRTSVAAEVTPELSRMIMGEDVTELDSWIDESAGFVETLADGAWRCHPLLRRAAQRRLEEDWPALLRGSRRATARWNVEHGDRAVGLALAAEIGDWPWAASALVQSLAVPSLLLGVADQAMLDIVDQGQRLSSEPLIVAADAIAGGAPEVAESALARTGQPGAAASESGAYQLTDAIIRMAVARASADVEAGLAWVAEGRRLCAELSTRQRLSAPELPFLFAAHEAAFWLERGDLARAVALLTSVLDSARRAPSTSCAEAVALSECLGLLAWLHALRGQLATADRLAADVLTVRPADGDEMGVGYARLAAAWVHLERGDLDEARQRLVHMTTAAGRLRDPWLTKARALADARVATIGGEPEVAIGLLIDLRRTLPVTSKSWLADRSTVALAEAHLEAGEAQRALTVLTPEPTHARVEARLVAARARHAIGDRRGARALIVGVADRAGNAPVTTLVQLWSLEAVLASESGEGDRAQALVTRVLRTARREQLRSALAPFRAFLSTCVGRRPDLARDYRAFMATVRSEPHHVSPTEPPEVPTAGPVEPLTERELQVLERLAQFLTTDEIAGDLFLSINTVKTHIKSLFLKLSVNRRADAVRCGRGLGLC